MPGYITIKRPYIKRSAREGFIAVAIYEFDESRFPEASKDILNQLRAFHSVPGFACSTQVWAEAEEALKYARFALKSKAGFLETGR